MALTEAPPPATERKPPARPLPKMQRQDLWWVQPMITAVVLGAFGIFATWRAFENAHYQLGNYLSPFYSPEDSCSLPPG